MELYNVGHLWKEDTSEQCPHQCTIISDELVIGATHQQDKRNDGVGTKNGVFLTIFGLSFFYIL